MHPPRLLTRLLPLLASVLALSASIARAQMTPIQVTTAVIPPYSSKASEWERHPERITVTVTNTDPTKSYNIRLSGSLEEMGGAISIVTKDDYPVAPITVPAGGTRVLNGNDLKVFSQNAVRVTGPEASSVVRTGQLPEGTYRLCVEARDHATLAKLSPRSSCASFTVRTLEAPQLVAPPCDMKVTVTSPQNVLFQWTPPAGAAGSVTYTLSMVEIVPPSRNPEEALNTAVPPRLVVRQGQTMTMYRYGATEPELKPGARYAWRVQAVDPTGATNFRNDGKSAVCTFSYGADSCTSLAFSRPVMDGSVGDNDPLYVILGRGIRNDALRGATWQLVELKESESASASVFGDGRNVMSFSLPPSVIASAKTDHITGQALLVGRVQKELKLNGDALVPGRRYAVKMAIEFNGDNAFVDGGSCGSGVQTVRSDVRSFKYITGNAGCVTITNVSPVDGAFANDSAKLTVEYSDNLREANLTRRTYEVTELKAGETPATVNFEDPARTIWRLKLGARSDLSGQPGGETHGVGALQDRLMMQGDPRFVVGRRYAWRFILTHVGKGLFADGSDCYRLDTATSTSAPTEFTYSDLCVSLAVVHPKGDAPVTDTSELRARLSAKLKSDKLNRVRCEFVELGDGESATTSVFDRDAKMSITLGKGTFNPVSGTSFQSMAFTLSAAQRELALNGDKLKEGGRYAWRLSIDFTGEGALEDGSSCGMGMRTVTSDAGSFTYNGCVSLAVVTPVNDASVTDSSDLKGTMSQRLKVEKIKSIRYQFVELRDGETNSPMLFSDGRSVMAFTLGTGNAAGNDRAFFKGASTTLSGAQKELMLAGDKLVEGKRYAWRMAIDFIGDGALEDGSSCGTGTRTVTSNTGSFIYNGCASLTIITPINDAPVADSSELRARLSARLKSDKMNRVHCEFVELRDGETPSAAAFGGARSVMSINLGKGTFNAVSGASFQSLAFTVSAAQRELRLAGDQLAEGKRYAWRMGLEFTGDGAMEDGTSCGSGMRTINSNVGSFIYNGCMALTVERPLDDAPVTDTTGMRVDLSSNLNNSKVQGATWEFITLNDGEKASAALFNDGREVTKLPFGSGSFLTTPVTGHGIFVSRARKELSMLGENLESGKRYAFRVSINFTGEGALADGGSCGSGTRTVTSNVGSFTYTGCVALNATRPVNDATVEDSSAMVTDLSANLKLSKMQGATWEIIELKGDEKADEKIFSDGREVMTLPFGTSIFLGIDPHTGPAISVSRAQSELAMLGSSLRAGHRYAWRASITFTGDDALADGGSCGTGTQKVTSTVGSFIYAGCLRISVVKPKKDEEMDAATGEMMAQTNRPFMVSSVRSRAFELVELEPGENPSNVEWNDGRQRLVLPLPGGTDSVMKSLVGMKFAKMLSELELQQDTLKPGSRYAWRVVMEVQGDKLFGENLGCGSGTFTVASDTGSFVYGGCLKLTVKRPKNGEEMDIASGDLYAPANRNFLINGVKTRTFELVEMKPSEKTPTGIDWRDGRQRFVVPLAGGDTARQVNVLAMNFQKLTSELALQGDTLTVGARYAWRGYMEVYGDRILPDGASCGTGTYTIASDTGMFTYGGCLTLKVTRPTNGAGIDMVTGDLQVKTNRPFVISGTKSRTFELVEIKPGEDPSKVNWRDGRKRLVVPLPGGDTARTTSVMGIYISKVNNELALIGDSLTVGSRYAWRAIMEVDGKTIFEGGASCGDGRFIVVSDTGLFTYSGCMALTNVHPANGANLSMVGDSLDVKSSRRAMIAGVKGRHFEIAELRYGEKPEEIDFRDGARKLHVIPLSPGSTESTASFTSLRMDSKRILDELALQKETLVPGSRYAWRAVLTVEGATIFGDSGKCADGEYKVYSTPTAFVYGSGACVKVEGAYPEDGSNYEQEDDPSFSVTVKDGIRKEGITGGRLKIWKQLDGVSVDSAMRTKAIFEESFTGNDEKKVYIARNTAQMTGLNLTFVNSGTGSKSFKPELGATYVWAFSLNAEGRKLMQDTTMTCSDSVLTMAPNTFTFRGGGTNECGDGAPTTAPDISDKTPDPGSSFVGKTIQVGLFKLNVTESNGTGSGLSGKGTIKVATIKAPIKVEFKNVKVNRNLAMYDGKVTAQIEEDGGVIAGLYNTSSGKKLDISDSKGAALGRLLSDVKRQATSLVATKPVGLPLGLDAMVEGKTYTVGIVGMTFEPKQAQLDVAFRLETPDLESGQSTAFINFGARDIPMSPNKLGPSNGSMKLYVAGDLTLNMPGGMQFKVVAAKDDELDNDNRGTYVKLKCGKFDGMRLEAAALFPRDWLVPRMADGKADPDSTHKSRATFVAQIRNWSNWIAKADLTPSYIAGEDGFGLEVKEIAYDHSDVANPDAIVFPSGYAKATDNTWRGFFIGRAAVSLPESMSATDEKGKNLTFSVSNMLLDNTGLTATFAVENVVSKGIMAGWGFSIDKIAVELISSSFKKGYMNGRLKMPVSEDALAYQCLIQQGTNSQTKKKQLQWQFQIKPEEGKDYTASFWKAKLKFDKTSNITIGTVAGGGAFNARAELTGAVTINDSTSKLKMPELRFEQFVAQSNPPKGENRISCKKWSFTSPAKSVGGFPLSVENVGLDMVGDTAELKFDTKISLSPGSTSIAGALGLKIRARLNMKAEEWGQKLEYVGTDLTKIKVDADLGAVEIHGQIDFYKQDAVYGDGFRGKIDAKFLKTISVGVTAQFGSKPSTKTPGETFRYWYVDAMARFNPGIVLGPAVGIYGFGGGAWYHMAPKNQLDPKLLMQQPENSDASKDKDAGSKMSKIGATLSGEEYVPNEDTWFGFKASVTVGTVPEPKAANGDVQLSISFTSSGGLERIRFDGSLYFACDLIERKDPSLYAGASILYDNVNKIFHAVFDVKMNFKVLTGEANTVIHFEPKWWQVKIGEPARRAKLVVNLEILKLNINAYLMAGDSLPSMPDPPEEVMSILNGSPKIKERLASSGMIRKTGASGFMFGAGVGVGPVGGSFLCFYGEFGGGAGFDIDLKKYSDLYCAQDPNTPIGFNGGWYAQGQMWAWLKAAIGIKINIFGGERKFDILAIQAALLMRMGGPNPIWMEGYVAGKYSILGGLIKGDVSFFVELGQKCRPVKGDPLSEMELITDIRPNSEDQVPVRVNPQTTFLLPLNESIMLPDLNQPEKILTYRLKADGALVKTGSDSSRTTGMMGVDLFDRHRATYRPADYLYPFSQYRFDVTVTAQEYVNGEWKNAYYTAAGKTKPVTQTKSATFTTGPDVNYIEDVNVAASYPAHRQRYFIPSMVSFFASYNTGYLALYQNQRVLTTYEDGTAFQKLVARFTPRDSTKPVVEENVGYTQGNGDRRAYLSFSVAKLQTGTLYDLELLKVSGFKPGASGSSSLLDTLTLDSTIKGTIGASMGEGDTSLSLRQQRNIRKLGGVYLNPETKNRERQLFKMTFGTSVYFSLDSKMRGLDFKRVDRYDQGQVVDKLVFHYQNSEPFDYTDVYGNGMESVGLVSFEQSLPYSYQYGTLKSAIDDRIRYSPVYNGSRVSVSYYSTVNGRSMLWLPGSPTSAYYAYIMGEYGYDYMGRTTGRATAWFDAVPFEIDKHSLAIGLTDEEIATGVVNRNPPTISYGDWESYPYWPGGTPGNVRFIQNISNNWRAFCLAVFQPLALQAVNDATWGRNNGLQIWKANLGQTEVNALWGDINHASPCYWPILPAGAYWIKARGPWRGDGMGREESSWIWNYYNGASPRRCPYF